MGMYPEKELGFTEDTIFTVYDALKRAGLSHEKVRECITDLRNHGIVFREWLNVPPHAKPVVHRASGGTGGGPSSAADNLADAIKRGYSDKEVTTSEQENVITNDYSAVLGRPSQD